MASLLSLLDDSDDADAEPFAVTAASSIRAAAAALRSAEEELTVQRQSTNLRRFQSAAMAGLLAAGTKAAHELAHTRTAEQARQRVQELEAELAAARQQTAAQARRAMRAEEALRDLQRARDPARTRASSHDTEVGALAAAAAATPAPEDAPAPAPSSSSAPSSSPPSSSPPSSSPPSSTCREVIESIRTARLGSSEELKALVGRALSALSRDLYSGAARLLAELVQNADDNQYSLRAPEVPTLAVVLHAGALSVFNNERGFSEAEVRALCDLGASTKSSAKPSARPRSGAIGRKGLGFKSVFCVSAAPCVLSNGFSFSLGGDERAGGAGEPYGGSEESPFSAIVPLWVEPAAVARRLLPSRCSSERRLFTAPAVNRRGGWRAPQTAGRPSSCLCARANRLLPWRRPRRRHCSSCDGCAELSSSGRERAAPSQE